MSSATLSGTSMGTVLAPVHQDWIERVTAILAPATDPDTTFWIQWGAARYLNDQFGDGFRLECALADAVGGFMPSEAVARLNTARAAIESTKDEFIASAQRRAPSALTAELARRLLDEIAHWCVEMQRATEHLPPGMLPGKMLARLRLSHAFGR